MSDDTRYLRDKIALAIQNADRKAVGLRPLDALDDDRDVRRLRRERDHARAERDRQRRHADLTEASAKEARTRRDQVMRACAELKNERRAARKLLASIPGAPDTFDLLELARWASERA